jgi:hypothetical protein
MCKTMAEFYSAGIRHFEKLHNEIQRYYIWTYSERGPNSWILEFLQHGLRRERLAPTGFRTSSKDKKIFLWGSPKQRVWQESQVLIKKIWNNFTTKFPKDILSVQIKISDMHEMAIRRR